MVEQSVKHKAAASFRSREHGTWGVGTLNCRAERPPVTKNGWLEMAYHEGYLSRRKFRELKKRYDKVYALVNQGRESPMS